MNQKLINKLSKLLDIEIKTKNTTDNILLIDRGNIDPVIRGCLVSQVVNDVKNLNIEVLIEKKKNLVIEIYEAFGIKNFIFPPKLKYFYTFPLITIKAMVIFFKEYLNFLLFKDFKWMINNLKFLNIHVGDLIYDSYLRYDHKFLKPKKYDLKLIQIFISTIFKILHIESIFKKKNIKQVIVGSATYSNYSSITLRYAVKNNIPSIFAAWFIVLFYENYERLFLSRQKIFIEDLSKINLPEDWLNLYEQHARSRYLGKVEHPDFLNAYRNKAIIEKKELFKRLKINPNEFTKIVLIAPHAFSDASHESFKNIFNDFYDHFISTLNHIKENRNLDKVLWVVNPHPSSHVYNEEGLVENILKEYNCKNIVLYPKDLNVFSVLRLVDTVITCNGTIGLEFPACFGKKSILAGDAPYSGLGFNIEPKSKKEYFDTLNNINNISPLTNEEKMLVKKTFYYYECIQLEFFDTTIIPANRFLKPFDFLTIITNNLENKKFADDPFYKSIKKLIKDKYN
tara:strand:- start:186 stop:1718 length:1533 start_codon:yes stop_codon:yes gene_type:complete